MKIAELPGQWVWVTTGDPILFRSRADLPSTVPHDRIVRIERIIEATDTQPPIAVWSDTEGEYGIEARLAGREVVSLPPSGSSPVAKAAEAIERRVRGDRAG